MDFPFPQESASRLIHSRWLIGLVWILGGFLWAMSTLPLWESSPGPVDAKPRAASGAIDR